MLFYLRPFFPIRSDQHRVLSSKRSDSTIVLGDFNSTCRIQRWGGWKAEQEIVCGLSEIGSTCSEGKGVGKRKTKGEGKFEEEQELGVKRKKGKEENSPRVTQAHTSSPARRLPQFRSAALHDAYVPHPSSITPTVQSVVVYELARAPLPHFRQAACAFYSPPLSFPTLVIPLSRPTKSFMVRFRSGIRAAYPTSRSISYTFYPHQKLRVRVCRVPNSDWCYAWSSGGGSTLCSILYACAIEIPRAALSSHAEHELLFWITVSYFFKYTGYLRFFRKKRCQRILRT